MFRKMILIVTALSLILGACSSLTGSGSGPINLTDGLGRAVTLSAPAQRVVSLAASNTEILFAVGAGKQVVGRDEFSDYPVEAKDLPSVGGSMGVYSLEAIAALKPDLVFAAEINTPEQVKSLEDLGLTVYYLKNPATLEEMYGNLEIAAALTGHSAEAAALIDSLKARVQAVDEKIMPLSYAPVVFYELDSTDPAKPFTAGPGSFVDLLIARAGGINVGAALEGQWAQIGLEQLLVSNPKIILLGDAMWGTTPESVAMRPGWDSLQAVQDKSIFPFDDNLVSRPGPRLVDGLEALAKILHPDLFK
jgi:iron complex transport system substrate-binding protein